MPRAKKQSYKLSVLFTPTKTRIAEDGRVIIEDVIFHGFEIKPTETPMEEVDYEVVDDGEAGT